MLEGPLFPNITRFTIPIILTSVLQLLFNAADLVVVGQFCVAASVAGQGRRPHRITGPGHLFIGSVREARAWLCPRFWRPGKSGRSPHCALPRRSIILGGAILTVAGLTYSETFLIMMGTPDTVLRPSVWLRIIFCGVTFNMVYNFCASILRAAGDTKSPLVFLLFAPKRDFESGFRHPVPDECGRCGAGDHHFSGGFRRAGGHRSDAQNRRLQAYTLTSCAFTSPSWRKFSASDCLRASRAPCSPFPTC